MGLDEIVRVMKGWGTSLLGFVKPCVPVFIAFVAGLILAGFWSAWLTKRRKKRELEQEKRARERAFTLPDRENSFVRERLNGALKSLPDDGLAKFDLASERARIGYVQKLLAKLKASPLAVADRLETNRLARSVLEYAEKEKLTLTEAQKLCDCFLSVLKLAAKYSV
ncbi:MAG: hypothetical protein IJV80_00930 [Clostridia bacterium]|nr:hypothetical protein [Clostridia bacterium]